jgi:hypothetical protein
MSWREQILSEFNPQVSPFLIVEDADGLLHEPGLLETLECRGYEIIAYEDPIAFRYFYESRVRDQTHHPLVVSVDGRDYQARALPYDLLQAATVITISLARLFPDIQFEVLAQLQPQELDALDQALTIYNPGRMGENLSRVAIVHRAARHSRSTKRLPREHVLRVARRRRPAHRHR